MRIRALALAGSAGCLCPAALFLFAAPAQAACDLSPTAGNSVYICDSGNDPDGLIDTDGTNNLTMAAPGGPVTGNVTFGNFVDTVTIDAGTISGTVSQGSGLDVFIMTGGQIGALQQ